MKDGLLIILREEHIIVDKASEIHIVQVCLWRLHSFYFHLLLLKSNEKKTTRERDSGILLTLIMLIYMSDCQ